MLDFFKHDYGKVEPMFKVVTLPYIEEVPKPVIIKRQTTQKKVKKTLYRVKARKMRVVKRYAQSFVKRTGEMAEIDLDAYLKIQRILLDD